MPKKEESPLQGVLKENESVKKQVEKFIKTTEVLLKKKSTDDLQRKEAYTGCKSHLREVTVQIEKVTQLKADDEPSMKPAKFETKIKEEDKKLNLLQEKLEKLQERCRPEDVTEVEDEEEEVTDEEVDEEEVSEEEDDDDTEDDDEETETVTKSTPRKPVVKAAVAKPVKAQPAAHSKNGKVNGVVAESLEEEEDDEESEEDEEDETTESHHQARPGAKAAQQSQDSEEEDDEDEDEDEDEESEDETTQADPNAAMASFEKGARVYEALGDFTAEQKGDLSFQQGDILKVLRARPDGWMEAVNKRGKKGMVPITFLKVAEDQGNEEDEEEVQDDDEEDEEDEEEDTEAVSPRTNTPRSGRQLWKSIKDTVQETTASDVLQAMGAVPSGFRQSTLAEMKKKEEHSLKGFLMPKLSTSCLGYRDLFLDPRTGLIRPLQTRIQRIVQVVEARNIPPPGVGLEVKSHHVRVCLFDGENVLSNVHTIRTSHIDEEKRMWYFNHKVNDTLKTIQFGEFFIRSDLAKSDIGILFELCVSYERTSSKQIGEFSCGWAFLPLFDQEGRPVDNKGFDEQLNGGTPYEKGVDVDQNIGRTEQTSRFKTLLMGNKQPRLSVRLQMPTRDQASLLDTLPTLLVAPTVYIQYISLYRQFLTDKLLKESYNLQSSEPVYDELISMFPSVADQPDLMDALRYAWAEAMRTAKRAEKKDPKCLKTLFRKIFLHHIYPVVQSTALVPYDLGNLEAEKARHDEIQRISRVALQCPGGFSGLFLSQAVSYKPFDVQEMAFNIINPHCIPSH